MAQDPDDADFEALIRYIQESRGVDFRGYKRTSLRRRITLRMETVGAESFTAYHGFLEAHPQEFVDLLNTVLINVTSFFRDSEAWDVVRAEVIPRLIASDRGRDMLRIWSAGCASGEEPYSLAMLLAEAIGPAEYASRVKIYATDLDEHALNAARHAVYQPRDVESVPAELLEKYFERADNRYVVERELRKSVIFGRHNIVHDAPISRIDLLVCRNLLIYLESETQAAVLPRLHYALVTDGVLFLGRAETQLVRSKLFRPLDIKHRLFTKLPQEWRRAPGGGTIMDGAEGDEVASTQARLLDAIANASPIACLALDNEGTLIFSNAAARRMLDVGGADVGRPFQDLAISYRPTELRSRIEEARLQGRPVRIEHREHHRPPADPIRLTIDITPLPGPMGSVSAILLAFTDTTRAFLLQQELTAAQESLETTTEELQSANEELETINEELQSTNEELETTNEELQSTNEELETTNEELRSTNEELEAINEELRRQSKELDSFRRDADAIWAGMDAGIIALNADLKVRLWNRWSEEVWGLRAEEALDRPFLELDVGLPVETLRSDLERVLSAGTTRDRSLTGMDRRGRTMHCWVRISPLPRDNEPSRGAVLIIEGRTEVEQNAAAANYLGRVIGKALNEVYFLVYFLDPDTLRFTLVNRGAEQKLGYGIGDLERLTLPDLMPGVSREAVRALVAPLTRGERSEVVVETRLRTRGGRDYPAQICLQYFGEEHPPLLLAIVQGTADRQQLAAS